LELNLAAYILIEKNILFALSEFFKEESEKISQSQKKCHYNNIV